MGHSLLDLCNGLTGIEMLRANLGAVHDGVAPVELEGIVEVVQALRRHLVAGILDPSVGLHEDGRSQVLIGVPPVGRTGRRAAGAEDAFVHAVELGPILLGLEEFTLELGVSVRPGKCPLGALGSVNIARLQPWLNGTVLFVEIAHVRDQILENVHVREGVYFGGRLGIVVDVGQTGEGVASLYVHGAGSADSLAATPTKGETRVLLVLDLDEGVENHRTAIVQVDRIGAEVGLLVVLFRVPSIDFEVLDALFGRRLVDGSLEVGFRGKRGSL